MVGIDISVYIIIMDNRTFNGYLYIVKTLFPFNFEL